MNISVSVPAANGNGTAATYVGGRAMFAAHGTWDSGTATLQASIDGTNYFGVKTAANQSAALTADGMHVVDLPKCYIRVVTSGSSGSTDVTAYVSPIWEAIQLRDNT